MDVPQVLVRYYAYWLVFYILAAVGHGMALVLFYQTGVEFMAAFNVISVLYYIVAVFLLKAGYYQTAYWGAIIELVLHCVAATICVGLEYGFTNYTFLVTILLFVQPFYSWRFSILMAAATLMSAALLTYYAVHHPPLYVIPSEWVQSLSIMSVVNWPVYVLIMILPFIRASARAEKEIAAAYGESERLLLNILPEKIARRLKSERGMIADDREPVAILFADIVGFTDISGRLQPAEIVTLLNDVFNAIDGIVDKYGAEKIKTIGDAYMAVAGLPDPADNAEEIIARLALDIQREVARFHWPVTGDKVSVRIGLNSGKVVAGVIGNRKFAYDLWGDAVNVAARMEATGTPGKIHVTDNFQASLASQFLFEHRGEMEIKGKGKITTYFLSGERPASN